MRDYPKLHLGKK